MQVNAIRFRIALIFKMLREEGMAEEPFPISVETLMPANERKCLDIVEVRRLEKL